MYKNLLQPIHGLMDQSPLITINSFTVINHNLLPHSPLLSHDFPIKQTPHFLDLQIHHPFITNNYPQKPSIAMKAWLNAINITIFHR